MCRMNTSKNSFFILSYFDKHLTAKCTFEEHDLLHPAAQLLDSQRVVPVSSMGWNTLILREQWRVEWTDDGARGERDVRW